MKKILIIEDNQLAAQEIAAMFPEAATAVAFSPDGCQQILDEDPDWDLAVVDMDFVVPEQARTSDRVRRHHEGALGVMTALTRIGQPAPRRPRIPFIINSAIYEESRSLPLVAAFTLFEPVALRHRWEPPATLRDAVDEFFEHPDRRSIPAHYRLDSQLLYDLVRNQEHVRVWKALTVPGLSLRQVAEEADVTQKQVGKFNSWAYDPVIRIEALLDGDPDPGQQTDDAHRRDNRQLATTCARFAIRHTLFLNDPALPTLVAQPRWHPTPKTA